MLTSASQVAFYGDIVSGTGLTVNGGAAIQIVHDTFSLAGTAITIGGGANGITIDYDTIASNTQDVAVTTGGAAGLDIRDNQMNGVGSGIVLTAAAGGTIAGNDISVSGTGIGIAAAFTGAISANMIHNSQTGVNYQAAAALSANSIHDNATGVVSTVPDATNGFGFVGNALPNQIFDNNVGAQLNTATMQNQHVYDNSLGVGGTGSLVASDMAHANLLEANLVTLNFTGPIEFNRITREAIGIEAQSGQLIAYNILYGNTQPASTCMANRG